MSERFGQSEFAGGLIVARASNGPKAGLVVERRARISPLDAKTGAGWGFFWCYRFVARDIDA